MKVTRTAIPDVLLIEPRVFGDERRFFFESFNQRAFSEASGLSLQFVQDNHTKSAQGVLRGLHYQLQQAQGKLVRVVAGEVLDIAVDIREGSPTLCIGWPAQVAPALLGKDQQGYRLTQAKSFS